MRKSFKHWTVSGDGYQTVTFLFGIGLYQRVTQQNWSPAMVEVEVERGITIGHVRLGLTFRHNHFKDGQQPSVVRSAF